MKFPQLFKQLISWTLALQIFGGAPLAALAQSRPAPIVQDLVRFEESAALNESIVAFEKFASELEASESGQFPARSSKDTFKITQQELQFPGADSKVTSYNLSQLNVNLPTAMPTNFEKEVFFRILEDGSLALDLLQKGKVAARHVIRNVKPVAMARDKDFLVYLDADGKFYAIDLGYARMEAFKTPIPVVELVQSPIKPEALDVSKLSSSFMTRETRPYDEVMENGLVPTLKEGADRIHSLGDFLLMQESGGKRSLVAQLDRAQIRSQLYTAEAVLAALAPDNKAFLETLAQKAEAPFFQPEKIEKNSPAFTFWNLMRDEKARAQVQDVSTNGMDPVVAAAYAAYPRNSIEKLLMRAQVNKSLIEDPRDQLLLAEWQASTLAKQNAATAQLTENSKDPVVQGRAIVEGNRQALARGKVLSIMAKVLLGTAATAGAVWLGASDAGNAWAMKMVNDLYTHYVPDVLKDASYRMLLLKSSIALSAFVPLLYGVGLLVSKTSKSGWSAIKTLCTGGMRIYGALQLPFIHRLGWLFRQPNFIRAMQMGANPFSKVKKDSALGRKLGLEKDIRIGANAPMISYKKSANRKAIDLQNQALAARVSERERVRTLAWTLALQTVSEDSGIDAGSLTLLIENGAASMTADQIKKFSESQDFRKRWAQVSTELESNIVRMSNSSTVADFDRINPAELARYYGMAKETAQAVKSRGAVAQIFATVKTRLRSIRENSMRSFANFGVPEYEFLKRAEPEKDIQDMFWKQFVTDYLLSVGQVAVVGDRANLNDPQALAAADNGLAGLWTSPGHRFDMIDQVRIYGISVPGRYSLVYQFGKQLTSKDESYDPIENTSMKGIQREEGLFSGIINWTKAALNIEKANYGFNLWNGGVVRTIRTIQVSLLMSMVGRVFVGHQPVFTALGAFAFSMIWAQWAFGWMWEPVNMGNSLYEKSRGEINEKLMSAKSKMAQGIRLNDTKEVLLGYRELSTIYQESNAQRPQSLGIDLEKMESLLAEVSDQDLQNAREDLVSKFTGIDRLRAALASGDQAEISKIRLELVEQYQQSGVDGTPAEKAQLASTLLKLNSLSLLEFTLKNPPVATKANSKVTWISTLVAALVTTYYGTKLFVATFREGVSWTDRIVDILPLSIGLYAATYFGQKFWNKISQASRVEGTKANKAKVWVDSKLRPMKKTVTNALHSCQDWLRKPAF